MTNEVNSEKMVKPTKSLTCFDKDKNLNKIKQLNSGLQKLQGSSINLKIGFPWKSSSESYLEDVISRAYKTTLRVNNINIKNNVPKNMFEKLWTYQISTTTDWTVLNTIAIKCHQFTEIHEENMQSNREK